MAGTIRAALSAATECLSDGENPSPRLDAEVLLRHLLGWDRTRLVVALPDPFPTDVARDYDALIARRAAGEPVAYIVGEREFMGLPFAVGPGVLVPRPETECLVEWVAARVRAEPRWSAGARIVDVGTGSGAIALSLATLLPAARIIGIERSAQALGYARTNRARLDLAGRVGLIQGDLLGPIGAADVIAANLPYLRTDQAHVGIAQEPAEALYAGDDGLDLYRALLPQAARLLCALGLLAAEIDPEQSAAMVALCRAAFPHATIAVARDLAGLDRFVTVQQSV